MKFPKIPYSYLLYGPAMLFVIGFAMNSIVIAANHGQMPVLFPGGGCPDISDDPVHVCMTASTHLKFLADWIMMVSRGELQGLYSPGDFVEMLGEFTMKPAFLIWFGAILSKIEEK